MFYRAPDHTASNYVAAPQLDLVGQAEWENEIDFISLEEAGLEEDASAPIFGMDSSERPGGGVWTYVDWFNDGDSSGRED